MRAIPRLRAAVVLLALGGLSAGLINSGVRAGFTDGGTAQENVAVGTFSCQLSSTDPNWVYSNNNHTATLTWPSISSSAASTDYSNLTVTNTGQIPLVAHWTESTGGTIAWQPSGRMGFTLGIPSMATDVQLAAGAGQTYTSLGFTWNQLTNADLGQSATVTYSVACSEVPSGPPPYSGPLTFTMGNANPATGVGPGNSFQIYGDIHNGATSGGVWKTMNLVIPFTLSGVSGDTLSVSMITSYFGGTASISGGNIDINVTNPYTNLTLFGPGGTKTGAPLAYIGANPTYGATVTFGTPYITAST